MIYDVIGDIHGHAEKLKGLLKTLGYTLTTHPSLNIDYYCPPEGHRALFIGDLIDRGTQELETLQIVFAMIDADVADAVMGNHEYNALAYATEDKLRQGKGTKNKKNKEGKDKDKIRYLRSHNRAHTHQHQAFLDEIPFGSEAHQYWLNRFYELPLWIETEHACFVHACWDTEQMAVLEPLLTADKRLTLDALQLTGQKKSDPYEALERILKGVEVALPEGVSFTDKDGKVRRRMRVQWWLSQQHGSLQGRRIVDIARAPGSDLAQIPQDAVAEQLDFMLQTDKPVFIGHYWLTGTPEPLSPQVVCTDYSAAGTGYLTAYRFDTTQPFPLSADNFIQYIPETDHR
ncbi:metallophosphoesterase [Psychrobacter sp. FDAARGOS_221]|uniref:metallophosphoesterase n=1 Tax=Psychrobacter sp. FDAARGOS_221 TaxID=1975705 RepID=UPI000BB545D3|nr:metallophosphoesterase [Psychrobacter sp. FDAARGOS_221]PNK60940.1 phosphoesterase [Psychrobacter sp. FDAARGOS_221]